MGRQAPAKGESKIGGYTMVELVIESPQSEGIRGLGGEATLILGQRKLLMGAK